MAKASLADYYSESNLPARLDWTPIRSTFVDRSNMRVGRLIVLYPVARDSKTGQISWLCRCDCGTYKRIKSTNLAGTTKSCGCKKREGNQHKHGSAYTAEYHSFTGAKYRCINPAHHDYQNYGGRGIEFRFDSFEEFYAHLGPKPSPSHSLDRINVNGHYEPGNVRWATPQEQNENTRLTRFITAFGKTQALTAWARELGIKSATVVGRLRSGWCEECALTQPTYPNLRQSRCAHVLKLIEQEEK